MNFLECRNAIFWFDISLNSILIKRKKNHYNDTKQIIVSTEKKLFHQIATRKKRIVRKSSSCVYFQSNRDLSCIRIIFFSILSIFFFHRYLFSISICLITVEARKRWKKKKNKHSCSYLASGLWEQLRFGFAMLKNKSRQISEW